MPLTEYDEDLSPDGDELRVITRTERGQVVDFVVQYEAILNEVRYQVVRYDGSHGRAHRDTLDADGETIRKVWLDQFLSFSDAITIAIDDIKSEWPRFREAFLRRLP